MGDAPEWIVIVQEMLLWVKLTFEMMYLQAAHADRRLQLLLLSAFDWRSERLIHVLMFATASTVDVTTTVNSEVVMESPGWIPSSVGHVGEDKY